MVLQELLEVECLLRFRNSLVSMACLSVYSHPTNRLIHRSRYKVIFVSSGAELATKGRDLSEHFATQGTPIMMGGGVLACVYCAWHSHTHLLPQTRAAEIQCRCVCCRYTMLGVDFNATTGEIAFLILDPHYIGEDKVEKCVPVALLARACARACVRACARLVSAIATFHADCELVWLLLRWHRCLLSGAASRVQCAEEKGAGLYARCMWMATGGLF